MQTTVPYDQIGASSPGLYQNANPSAGIRGSIPNADFFNAVQAEIMAVITARGLTPSGTDLTQLFQAIRRGELNVAAGTADAMVITPATPYTSLPSGTVVAVVTPGAAGTSNATPTPTLQVNNVGPLPIRNQNGGALAAGDLPAGGIKFYVSGGDHVRTLATLPSEAAAAPVSTTTQTAIYEATPAGDTKLHAFTGGAVNSDISEQQNGYTIVLSTGQFTGAHWMKADGDCSLRNVSATSGTVGGTVRFALTDLTTGVVTYGDYLGGGVAVAQAQVGLTVPSMNLPLNPAHTYFVSILAQKGTGGAQTQTFDPAIRVEHDGDNL